MQQPAEPELKIDFRDEISTVNQKGKRVWIYPKKPSGKFYTLRELVTIILLALLIFTPFIEINNRPFFLLNVLERNFILFGIPFGPHDFYIFVIAMIAVIIFIFLFTAVFGRVFCGWICPQTVFMEMVFRKIEYAIEGDASSQKKLSEKKWNREKLVKKTAKHLIFFIIAFFISNIFLAYIIGADELLKIVTAPPAQHLKGFIAIVIFSGVFYWVFSFFREQACTIVCPYGRLQGVLLDKDSLVIAYDYKRGEPRGKLKQNQTKSPGDCVDCSLCVYVCPTGIDIRNGIQLECVNCTACIDACNYVMKKVNRPEGLIRYASLNGIENKTNFRFTPRAAVYSVMLLALTSLLVYLLSVRTDFNITLLRTPGLLYQQQDNDKVSNIYDLNIINKTFNFADINLKLENFELGELKLVGNEISIEPQGRRDAKFLIILPKNEIDRMNTKLSIGIYSNGKLIETKETSFLAPVQEQLNKKESNED
jgi:cytochrome c oxidase accessory protein FixG